MRSLVAKTALTIATLACIVSAADGSDGGSSSNGYVRLPADEDLSQAMTTGTIRQGGTRYYQSMPMWRQLVPQRPGQPHVLLNSFMRVDDKRIFGPLEIGSHRFQGTAYPADMQHFEHTYPPLEPIQPIDFEHLKRESSLIHGEWIFRPEPKIVGEIEHSIHSELKKQGQPATHVHGARRILQGEPVWPPVDFHPKVVGGLDMGGYAIGEIQKQVATQLKAHRLDKPTVFTFVVPTYHGYRRIMMTPVKDPRFVSLSAPSVNSDFYVLHEAMQRDGQREPVYALLGGMFLPKNAPELLKQYMTPAFLPRG